jgi:hypothetical protein
VQLLPGQDSNVPRSQFAQVQNFDHIVSALSLLPAPIQKHSFRAFLERAAVDAAAEFEDGFFRAILQYGHEQEYYDLSIDTDEISRLAESAAAAGRDRHVALLLSYDCDRTSADVRAKIVRICCAAACRGHAKLLAQVVEEEKVGLAGPDGEAIVLAAYAYAALQGEGALEPLRVLHACGADVTPAVRKAEASEKVALQKSIKDIKV